MNRLKDFTALTASIASATHAWQLSSWRGFCQESDMGCPTGKSVITSYELAEKARKRSTKKHSKPMSTYRCAICGALHLGAPNRPKQPVKTIRNNHQLRFT